MPLQNRVAPDGSLHEDAARGLFTGNRGIIHDPDTKSLTGRRWTTHSWICCSLDYKGVPRQVWGRNFKGRDGPAAGWTELFFLDEATALAAGHRPCFTCRREAAGRFIACYDAANGFSGSGIAKRDALLHAQRRFSAKAPLQRLSAIDLPGLPDGTMVEAGGVFHVLKGRRALRWHFEGYGKPAGLGELARFPVTLVTPRSVVLALRAGYAPVFHLSASD